MFFYSPVWTPISITGCVLSIFPILYITKRIIYLKYKLPLITACYDDDDEKIPVHKGLTDYSYLAKTVPDPILPTVDIFLNSE